MNRDIKSLLAPVVAMTQQTINTDTTTDGEKIDTQGFYGITFVIFTGTVTLGDVTPLIQDSDDNTTFADVTDVFLVGTEAGAILEAADDDSVSSIGYVGKKRYVRLSLVSDNSANLVVGAVALKGAPLKASVS